MDAGPVVKIQFLVGEKVQDLEAAAEKFPHEVSQAIELASYTTTRVNLQSIFSKSLLSERPKTPYRLQTVLASCSQKLLSDDSLEMQFFRRGGIRAVAALATALNSQTARTLASLSLYERNVLIDSIEKMQLHDDFRYICTKARRWNLSNPVKATYLPRGRSSNKRRREESKPPSDHRALSSDSHSNVLESPTGEDMARVPNATWDQTEDFPVDLDHPFFDPMGSANTNLYDFNFS